MVSPSYQKEPDDFFPGENLLTISGVGANPNAAVFSYLGTEGSNFLTSPPEADLTLSDDETSIWPLGQA